MNLLKLFFSSIVFSTTLLATSWIVNVDSTSASTSGTEYDNDQDISTSLSIAGSPNLLVSITGETEDSYDFVYITDSSNNTTRYDGTINKSFFVNGSSIDVRFTSDYSVTKSGITVSIEYDPNATVYNNDIAAFELVNPLETRNIIGNTQIIGNTVECVTRTIYADKDEYDDAYKDLDCDNTVGNYNNNNYTTKFLDIDNNASTYNSSSATIKLPNTYKEILWVGLYWQAHLNNNSVIYRTRSGRSYIYSYSNDYPVGGIESTNAYSVQLKIDSGGYEEVKASKVNYFNSSSYVRYSAYKDVTSYFKSSYSANSEILVTLANINASVGIEDGLGNYAAWSLVVVYKEDENNIDSKLRNNSVYSGFQYVSSGSGNKEIELNEFLLPKKGTIDSQMAVFAAEGEYRYSPDSMKLDGTAIGNPDKNNVFDARLSDSITRNPELINNNGIDIDVFDTSAIMTTKRDADPDATSYSSKIILTSDSDLYYPSMVSFTTELYKPRVCYYIDTIIDSNDNTIFDNAAFIAGAEINDGEEYTFNFWISNMKGADNTDVEIANAVQVYLTMTKFDYTSNSTYIDNLPSPPTAYTYITDGNEINGSADDLGEYLNNKSTWRVGLNASKDQGGTLDIATDFDDSENIVLVKIKGSLSITDTTTDIDLLDYLEFKASFQTDSITIGADNAQLIVQCQDLNSSVTAGSAPGGVFNVVMADQRPTIVTNGVDPLAADNSLLNAIPTQVSNRAIALSVLSLDDDQTTLKDFKGLVALELIEQPNYLDTDSEATKLLKCANAQLLSPISPEPTVTLAFWNDEYSDGTFTYPKANKDASFRVKYLNRDGGVGAIEWNCDNKNFSCLWGMLTRTYGNDANTPCESFCNPANVGANEAQRSEACISCVFGPANTGSACARDDFAIRPDRFVIDPPVGQDIELLTAGRAYNYLIVAAQAGTAANLSALDLLTANSNTTDYNITKANLSLNDGDLDANKTIYAPDDTVPNPILNGILGFTIADFDFSNGTTTAGTNFTDVGKVNIMVIDTNWSKVDIDHGDTVADCSANGAYVCGDVNATFIPDHFALNGASLFNTSGSTYTYLSNDLNMSASMNLTLTAENFANVATQNFTSNAWERPVNVFFNAPIVNGMQENKSDINTTSNLGFTAGVKTINFADTNRSANLIFNYDRAKDTKINPFRVQGNSITLNASSVHSNTAGTTTVDVNGTVNPDQNATFVYGRTHAPRHRFTGPNGTALIYYEIHCDGTINANACDKNLLPNGTNSKTSDDPRWFINTSHTVTTGVVGVVTQKGTSSLVTATTATGTNTANVALTYDFTSKGYPYKATMENNASSWLIYNPYDANDDDNDFEVEFTNSASSWAGQKETDTVTNRNASDKTNRRSMW